MTPRDTEKGHRRGRPRAPLESGLGFRIGRVQRLLREGWEKLIADLGLSAPQAAMLRAICERPGSGLRELARRMHTDPMNAKRLVDHLEEAGLVRSTTDPSHRQRRDLGPTEEGLALAERVGERAVVRSRQLSRLLGAADLAQLQHLLERLEQLLEAEAPAVGATESRTPRRDARR